MSKSLKEEHIEDLKRNGKMWESVKSSIENYGRTCQICGSDEDVQYLLVRNATSPQINHKEYLCQKHLRLRSAQLEFLRLSGELSSEIKKEENN